jgi:hypothetical protein
MIASSALLPDFRDGRGSGHQDALLWFSGKAPVGAHLDVYRRDGDRKIASISC